MPVATATKSKKSTKPPAPKTPAPKKRKQKAPAPEKSPSPTNGSTPVENKPVEASSKERKIIYPTIKATVYDKNNGLTVETAKKLLGWKPESENVKIREDNVLLTDVDDTKIECYNNVTNRPVSPSTYFTYRQEILMRRWVFNGEPIIIGKTGLVLNGQHQLIALILAHQELEKRPGMWMQYWDDSNVTIEKLVITGVEESDYVVNTMDTAKPRSLKDVIYRSDYFKGRPKGKRLKLSGILDHTVRFLWLRTNAGNSHLAPRRTHAEALDFIRRHGRILPCLNHIYEELVGLKDFPVFPGHAAGMLYVMGCSASKTEDYRNSDVPDETALEWSLFNKASDFWTLVGNETKETSALRTGILRLTEKGVPRVSAAPAVVAMAWERFVQDKPFTAQNLRPRIKELDEGEAEILVEPSLGPLDFYAEEVDEADDAEEVVEPATGKKAPKRRQKQSKPKAQKASKAGEEWAPGDCAWVRDSDDDPPYFAEVTGEPYSTDTDMRMIMVKTNDAEYEVDVDDLGTSLDGVL